MNATLLQDQANLLISKWHCRASFPGHVVSTRYIDIAHGLPRCPSALVLSIVIILTDGAYSPTLVLLWIALYTFDSTERPKLTHKIIQHYTVSNSPLFFFLTATLRLYFFFLFSPFLYIDFFPLFSTFSLSLSFSLALALALSRCLSIHKSPKSEIHTHITTWKNQ